jgi:hypothetical protein
MTNVDDGGHAVYCCAVFFLRVHCMAESSAAVCCCWGLAPYIS